MEDNFKHQLENTFSTCRRSLRILERGNKEISSTTLKPYSNEHKIFVANTEEKDKIKESLNGSETPEGKLLRW